MAYQRRMSASQLNMLHGCKMQYYQSYILKNKQPTTSAMVKGTALHSISEEFYKFDIRNAGVTYDNYKSKFTEHMWRVFDEQLEIPREYFGRPLPSVIETLKELHPDAMDYTMEIADIRGMTAELLNTFLQDYKVKLAKYKNPSQAFYIVRPKYTEFKIETDTEIAYIDEVLEIDGNVVLVDLKTSNAYKSLFDEKHFRQLKFYAFMFFKQTGKLASYGVIKYIRTGFEMCYPLGANVIEEIENEIKWYWEVTSTTNIEDYPCGIDYQFCTCNAATIKKNRGRGWCYYENVCNSMLGCEDVTEDVVETI